MFLLKPKGAEPHVESRARDQAHWLIRDHGDEAEAVLAAKMRRQNVSDADRHRYQLTARALRDLRAEEYGRYGDGEEPIGPIAKLWRMLRGQKRDSDPS